MSKLEKLFKYIDENEATFKATLKEAVAIPSVSGDVKFRNECVRMVNWTADKLKELGVTVTLRDVGCQIINGEEVKLPDCIIGTFGNDKSKKTLCVYGHLDVQPAVKSDGWHTEPFELVEKDGKLFGRGSTDDKGPVLGWIHAINAYKNVGEEIPVNIKFILECMEESNNSAILDDLLMNKLKPEGFFEDVDFVVVSDNYWLGTETPCITYGLRGVSYFFVEVECGNMDLHSGVYGGTVHEAMADLIFLMSQLTDSKGNILIPGVMDSVAALTEDEAKLYENIDFDTEQYRQSIGAIKLAHNGDKLAVLMHRWRYPTLSLHGIEGAAHKPGGVTVIPSKVVGKFSIRLVPNQEPEKIVQLVYDFLNEKFAERKSPNKLTLSNTSGRPWMTDPNHPNYQAAARAIKTVYKKEPNMTREGGSITPVLTLQEASRRNVLLLPMGAGDDMAHSQNEKINIRNYIEGTKVMAAYLHELSLLN